MGQGFMYLVAIIDWASRAVLAWRLSNTMDARSVWRRSRRRCAVGRPEIFNTDQGSQFTQPPSPACWKKLASRSAWTAAAVDGQRVHRAAVAVVKYEDVYLKGYADGREAAHGIAEWIAFTMSDARTRRSPTARRWRSGARRSPAPRLWT